MGRAGPNLRFHLLGLRPRPMESVDRITELDRRSLWRLGLRDRRDPRRRASRAGDGRTDRALMARPTNSTRRGDGRSRMRGDIVRRFMGCEKQASSPAQSAEWKNLARPSEKASPDQRLWSFKERYGGRWTDDGTVQPYKNSSVRPRRGRTLSDFQVEPAFGAGYLASRLRRPKRPAAARPRPARATELGSGTEATESDRPPPIGESLAWVKIKDSRPVAVSVLL